MRYALFAFSNYYPNGGWSDHVHTFRDEDDASAAAFVSLLARDEAQVVDLQEGRLISHLRKRYATQKETAATGLDHVIEEVPCPRSSTS